jgi:CubicO group peptidase (beta-lactamase class C family)
VGGTVAAGYEPLRAAFARCFERLGERGAALTVLRDGRPVADLWAGAAEADAPGAGAAGPAMPGRAVAALPGQARAGGDAYGTGAPAQGAVRGAGTPAAGEARAASEDAAAPRPWQPRTAQIVRSATKGAAAACVLHLHQRGLLDLDAPVAAYWTEFKAGGKDRVSVREALGHRAGVPALDAPLTPERALDGESGPRAVAAQAPFWTPGEAHGYHAHTYGWLVAELVRRVSGRTIGRYLAEEIAGPLGLDLWIGLPASAAARVGRIAPLPEPPRAPGVLTFRPKASVAAAYADPESLTRRAFGAIDPLPDENAPGYRAAELPSSAGVATARGLAGLYAALLGAPAPDGRRIFAADAARQARTPVSDGPDLVLAAPSRFGPGFMLHGPSSPFLSPASFGHPGRGGSLAFADEEHGVAFAYVTNGMRAGVTADQRPQSLLRALRGCLAAAG